VIMVLTPDTGQGALYKEAIAPNLTPGKTLMFAHVSTSAMAASSRPRR